MTDRPQISVVVATRNRAARLRGLLVSLRRQTLAPERFEVVVVDDGSTDETASALAELAASSPFPLHVLERSGGGPAAARNAGWRAARGGLIAFTDDDCEATPDWLARALAEATAHPGAIVQGPTTPIPSELERMGPFARTKEITGPNPSYQTCNIVYPRSLLERLGGFDEAYPEALGEDTDLGWRARELGTPLHWSNAIRMHHAVDELGPGGYLHTALRGADAVRVFRRHPELRGELRWGFVRNARLPWLALAVVGAILGRRSLLAAALLAGPYGRAMARRCRDQRATIALAPYYVAWDLLFAYTALRGSIRHRTLVL